MSEIENPPAFPVIAENGLGHVSEGMSLRDYFAAQAPEPPATWWGSDREDCAGYAMWGYQYADAMLRQRSATDGPR